MPEAGLSEQGEGMPLYGPELIQRLDVDWDLEVRIRADFSLSETAEQCVMLMLSTHPEPHAKRIPPFPPRPVPRIPPHPESAVCLAELGMHAGRLMYIRLGHGQLPMNDDTCTFYMQKRGDQVWTGADYYPGKMPIGWSRWCPDMPFLVVCLYSDNPYPPWKPFAAYVDYFRFTSVVY